MAKILIIDDDEKIVDILTKVLVGEGHQIAEANDGFSAVKNFHDFLPEMVITDMVMPDKDGTELIFQFKRECPGIKIIAMSGGGIIDADGYLEAAKEIGADAIFKKPFHIKEVTNTIKALLEK